MNNTKTLYFRTTLITCDVRKYTIAMIKNSEQTERTKKKENFILISWIIRDDAANSQFR